MEIHRILPALPEPHCPEREFPSGDCQVSITAHEHQYQGLNGCLWGHGGGGGEAPSYAD